MPSKSSDARLLAVYVVPLPTLGKLEKAYFSARSRLLADLAWGGASTKHDFKIDTLLETGDARKKTLTAVRGNGADIIVIGSHGMAR